MSVITPYISCILESMIQGEGELPDSTQFLVHQFLDLEQPTTQEGQTFLITQTLLRLLARYL
jgi:hypothetical protein